MADLFLPTDMNTIVISILRGMTDGYFLNIGHPEDTSVLETEFLWEGAYVNELTKSLHDTMEEQRCSGLIHYFTIHERFDALPILKQFFEMVDSIPGWKRRIIMLRVPHSEELKKYLTENYYTFASSEGSYDYFIHTIWDVLL